MAGRIYDENFSKIRPAAPPPLGAFQPVIRRRTIKLDTALDNLEVNIQGNLLYAIEASSKTVKITVKFNNQTGEGVPFKEGTLIAGVEYDRVYVDADAVSGGTIDLLYLFENGNFRALNPADQYNNIELVKSTSIVTADDVTLTNGVETLLIAANNDRRDVVITADPANANTIRVGDTGNVGASRGFPLVKGQSLSLSTTAAIYGFVGAAGQKVSILFTED